MSDRPDDIPEWAWDEAEEPSILCFDGAVDLYETGVESANLQTVIARAILAANKETYDHIAEFIQDNCTCSKGEPVDPAMREIILSIRSKAHLT